MKLRDLFEALPMAYIPSQMMRMITEVMEPASEVWSITEMSKGDFTGDNTAVAIHMSAVGELVGRDGQPVTLNFNVEFTNTPRYRSIEVKNGDTLVKAFKFRDNDFDTFIMALRMLVRMKV